MDFKQLDSLIFEHQFWLQILGDHSRFIFTSLAPKEKAEIEQAYNFIKIFDRLLSEAHQCKSDNDMLPFAKVVYDEVNGLREFKLHLICRCLTTGIDIHLAPTFINHMVNELEEYTLILKTYLSDGEFNQCHPLHYHNVWLVDAVGHAGFIHDTLDETERELRDGSNCHKAKFDGLHHKAMEYEGYLRTGLTDFPALERLNHQVNQEMDLFKQFLCELLNLRVHLAALGTISPLAPDHMYREECYYLTKLAMVGAVPIPKCDPTKPRIKV